jgi:hypothetical protein
MLFCSIFSRYGIHSLPSILMVNGTSRVRYQGPKNLAPLVQFYKKTTGKVLLSKQNIYMFYLFVYVFICLHSTHTCRVEFKLHLSLLFAMLHE